MYNLGSTIKFREALAYSRSSAKGGSASGPARECDLEHKSVQGTDAALDPDKYD